MLTSRSIVQYLVHHDIIEGRWHALLESDCRIDARVYGQHSRTLAHSENWSSLSPEDQERVLNLHRAAA